MSVFGKLLGRGGSDAKRQGNDLAPKSELTPDQVALSRQVPLNSGWPEPATDSAVLPEPAASIWDMDAVPAIPAPSEAVDTAGRVLAGPVRKTRAKTRLLGFDKSDGRVVDLFSNPVEPPSKGTRFPVGWIVVVKGPGRGESFTLQAGMSQIGRGEDQSISLDFGDSAISRTNHAAIVYDPESFQFFLGHGGKSNIVRLNDKPVISNELLKNGDLIRLGETTLRFVGLCDASFNWSDDAQGESENVEIA
jgi:hypothetical protein